MTTLRPASWAYAQEFVPEPDHIAAARAQGEHLGATPVGEGTGPVLRAMAASIGARAVVEIGSGAGVSGLWLLAGMPDDGILTTIDVNPEHLHAAKRAYAEAGFPSQRTRTILGSALTVLPRLTDGAYDLVVVDAEKAEYPAYVDQARRLLRSGGTMLCDNMLWHDKVADPTVRDEVTVALRDLAKALRDDPEWVTTLLPVGDGLLMSVKR